MAVTPGERCLQLDLPELPHNDSACSSGSGSGGWLNTDQPFLYGLASYNHRSFGSSGRSGSGFQVAEHPEDTTVAELCPC